ncbi:MAG: GNAT family N-acetyltransferase [Phormidesmis sp.]
MSQANAGRALPPLYQPNHQPSNRPAPFRIRAARSPDLAEIVSVLLASFYAQAQATQWLYWLMSIGIQADLKARISTPADQYICLVAAAVPPTNQSGSAQSRATRSRAVIGTAEISQRACETWQLFPPKRAYLSNLAVHPDYRRQGAAQQLLHASESIAGDWGFRHIYLHVMADNAKAQALYRQAGYRPCEVSNPILSGLGIRPQRLLFSKAVRHS